jgi:hypothetical protein
MRGKEGKKEEKRGGKREVKKKRGNQGRNKGEK